jgi:hypothetical protein
MESFLWVTIMIILATGATYLLSHLSPGSRNQKIMVNRQDILTKEMKCDNIRKYGTENPVFTNPPAKEMTLANKKRIEAETLQNSYNAIIAIINDKIKNGKLECNIALKSHYKQGLLAAARKVKSQGFNVKIRKSSNAYLHDIGHGHFPGHQYFSSMPLIGTYEYLYISWK